MHPIDYLVLGLLAVLVVLAVRYAVRHRGRCGGGCAGCPHADGCRSPKKRDPGTKYRAFINQGSPTAPGAVGEPFLPGRRAPR